MYDAADCTCVVQIIDRDQHGEVNEKSARSSEDKRASSLYVHWPPGN